MRADDHSVSLPGGTDEAFEDRVRCDIAQACGGCALIGHEQPIQLEYKRLVVREALAAWPELRSVAVEPCLPAPVRASYRNRARLVVANGRGRVRAGLERPEGQEVVDIASCRIQGGPTLSLLPRITDWLARFGLAKPTGPVKLIDVREATDERCHLTLVLECEPDRAPSLPVEDLAARLPELCGVAVNFNTQPASFGFGRQTRTVWGNDTFLASVPVRAGEPRVFEVPAVGFFQPATSQLPVIHAMMADHLGPSGALFDLYCGVGLHGLSLAETSDSSAPLVGVEENPATAACARRNAGRLGLPARIVGGKVERVLPRLMEETPPSRVILNPGRSGCRTAVLAALAPAPQRRLAYHACDPVTLARDLAALVARGWSVSKVAPFDMLPQTTQVEALALLDPLRGR